MQVLVGDVGGTNTTLAVVEAAEGRFAVREKKRYGSSALRNMGEAIADFSSVASAYHIEVCCISAAGPVRNNVCWMTNVDWIVDGKDVEQQLSIPTLIINDFSAISYALPLIDTHDEIDAVAIPHTDGSLPKSRGKVRAVVGAGTGLGTGYLVEDRGRYVAHASEGGHADFASTDPDMLALKQFVDSEHPISPGFEQYVSGQGISNTYRFFRDRNRLSDAEACRRIDLCSEREQPIAISAQAEIDPEFGSIMDLFVRMYARYASTAALFFLPSAGLYLAGGIAAKNQKWFTGGHRFMRTFESNYNPRVTPLLATTPVYIITDYDVSLFGAAHVAVSSR